MLVGQISQGQSVSFATLCYPARLRQPMFWMSLVNYPTRALLIQQARSAWNVRFGSKADMNRSNRDVCFTPKSGHPRTPSSCTLCAISGHYQHSLQSAGRSHDKLWRERQIAFVRYSLLNDRKDFLNIRMVDLATAASVLRHILDHRQ
jgi:hypothetical protein